MTTTNVTNSVEKNAPLLYFDYMDYLDKEVEDLLLENNICEEDDDCYNIKNHYVLEADKTTQMYFEDIVKPEINKWLEDKGKDHFHIFGMDGSLGLWNGPTDFFKLYCIDNIDSLLKRLRDTLNLRILLYSEKLEIYNIHHDGTNLYTIYPLDKIDKEVILHILHEELSGDSFESIKEDYGNIMELSTSQYASILYSYNIAEYM